MKPKNISVGIRVPKYVKDRFDNYCDAHGIKKNYLLSNIIEEKITELEEDEKDLKIALERIGDETVSMEDLDVYFKKRGV
jgi:predicted DNA-binding protein